MIYGTGDAALITTSDSEWVPLNAVYHYVLARSPSPESAKISIADARRNGQLRLRAAVLEHKANPQLRLRPGESPPQIQPERRPDQPILASDTFSHWDWGRSNAQRRDENTKSIFEYVNIVANRNDALRLWPPAGMTANASIANTALAKPTDVPALVWAVVLTLDDMQKEDPTGFAGLTQGQLIERVNAKLPRQVSLRTLQKAVAARRKRIVQQ